MKPGKKRRAPERRRQPKRKKRRTQQRRRPPINLIKAESVPEFSGFLNIRLLPEVVSNSAESLDEVTEEFKPAWAGDAAETLQLPVATVLHVGFGRTTAEVRGTRHSKFAPLHSLASY
jgi:hypothetical protein